MNCPKCGKRVVFEDHSLIGGDKEYWVCPNCNQEKIMFKIKELSTLIVI